MTETATEEWGSEESHPHAQDSQHAVAHTHAAEELTPQKQQALLTFHRTCWEEMTWRRNAGYRTVILGLAYCGLLLATVAYHPLGLYVRLCLAAVMALASGFGAGYLTGNYRDYMAAAARMVRIEEYLGAFEHDYLGSLGALMPEARRTWPSTPLSHDHVSLWSVITFAAGGLGTAAALLLMS
jgi:hypothetical protein